MVLVTGGTGFLGSYIIKNLVERGLQVRAIRRSPKDLFWIPHSVLEKIEWMEADLHDTISLLEAMEGVQSIIHSAARVSFTRKGRKEMYGINVEGTANVINAALESQVNRFIHVSSIAALGRTTNRELVNEQKKWVHHSNNTHYAISKYQAEMHVWRGFAEGLDGAIINPSTILGYGDWHQSSNTLFRNIYKGFNWYTRGMNGFVGVEDVAEAAVRLLGSDINHQRFIVNADNWVFQQLFSAISLGFDKAPPSREATRWMGELAWRWEGLRSFFTGHKPMLTKETAKIGHSQTSFDGRAILSSLTGFTYTPLETVIKNACEKYEQAVNNGMLSV